jgi:hypothetical protein
MKKIAISMFVVLISQLSFAQTMTIHKTDQTTTSFQLSQIDSITFSTSTTPTGGFTGNFLAWTGSGATYSYSLVRVNGQNGTVTNIGGNDYFPGMAYGPDGTLYGIGDHLSTINPSNGSTSEIGSFNYGSESGILMHGAAFSPSGTLYVTENATPSRVFSVNLSNATLTYVGTLPTTPDVWDLEFSSGGTLYGVHYDLSTLNPSNMSLVTDLGSTGIDLTSITFGSGGVLYGDYYGSTTLYSLNLSNGSVTSVATMGSTYLWSLVAERTSSSSSIATSDKATRAYGVASQRSKEELSALEKAVIECHNARLMNKK